MAKTSTIKEYNTAPLPFVGQKRRFVKDFKRALGEIKNANVFVDLFGGSGLLSHVAKRQRPDATVIYNDFDGYSERISHISDTNAILSKLRDLLASSPRSKLVPNNLRAQVYDFLARKEAEIGYVDYITIASSLMFAGKRASTLDGLRKHSMYNRVVSSDYGADGYLDGLVITHCDYHELFEKYKDRDDVVFIVDPPYLSTDCENYKGYWRLSDYLDVLKVLRGHRYFYFTSNKSSIVELADWLGSNGGVDPFAGSTRRDIRALVNSSTSYTDIMLYNINYPPPFC